MKLLEFTDVAALLALCGIYRQCLYGLSCIEVQKLAYFLQEAGEDMKLTFVQHKFGPYADSLRHALDRMDGHYIEGVGDGVVESEIKPKKEALDQAKIFLSESNADINKRIERVAELIDGFQSPYGMELRGSVHWVAKNDGAKTKEQALERIQAWNERKKSIMKQYHVFSAWNKLDQEGWLKH